MVGVTGVHLLLISHLLKRSMVQPAGLGMCWQMSSSVQCSNPKEIGLVG